MNKINSRWILVLAVAALFLLPLLVKAIFSLPRLMLQNFTDGVFYLGYAMHFGELVDRVGLNYYAVRFGAIFPDAVAFSLFGPVAGFSLVRYGLAGLVCVVLYLAFWKRFGSAHAGLFAAICYAFNAASIRLLQTGYVDVAGSFFLILGTGFVILGNGLRWVDFLAGACFGLAFWSHLHAGFALFFLLPLLFSFRWGGGWRDMGVSMLFWTLGGTLVTLCGVFFYGMRYGLWDITSPTREYMRLLTEEGLAARWSSPWGEVLRSNTFWFVPIPVLVALLVSRPINRLAIGAFVGLAGYIGFLLYGDLFRGGFSLSMFYYFSFVLAALVVCEAAIAVNQIKGRPFVLVAFLAAVVLPPLFIKYLPGGWFWFGLAPVSMVLAFALGFFLSAKSWRTGLVAAMFALAAAFVSGANSSRLALGNYWKGDDIGLLAIGQKLTQSLPKYQDDPNGLVFWYPNKDGTDSKMLQSLFLHNFTRFQNSAEDFVPFGPLGADALETLRKRGTRHLVVLDSDPATINKGIGWLKEAGLEFDGVRFFSIKEKKDVVHVGHVTLAGSNFSSGRPLSFELAEIQKRASAAKLSNGVKILTAPVKWNFDGFLGIPDLPDDESLRLVFEVAKGQVYLCLFKNQKPEGEICSRQFSAKSSEIETIFTPELLKGAKYLCIRNAAPNSVRSEWILRKIESVNKKN